MALLAGAAGAGLREEGGGGAGEAVEGQLEELHLVWRDVGRGLGAVREPVHGRKGQADEAGARGELPAGSLAMFLGPEMKVTKWPRLASCSATGGSQL